MALKRSFALRLEGREVGRIDVGRRHRQEILAAVAEPLAGGSIDLHELPSEIVYEDGIVREVEQSSESLLRLAQGQLGFIAIRDVYGGRNHAGDGSVLGPQRSLGYHVALLLARADGHECFVDLQDPVGKQGLVACDVHRGVGHAEFRHCLAHYLVGRPPAGRGECGVAELDPAIDVLGDDWDRKSVEELLHEASLLAESLVGDLSLGDVTKDAQDCRVAAELYLAGNDFCGYLRSISPDIHCLEDPDATAQDPGDTSRNRRCLIGRDDVADWHCEDFLTAVAQAFADDAVDFQEVAVRIVDHYAIPRVVEDRSELLLRSEQGLLDGVSFGDVLAGRDRPRDLPGLRSERCLGHDQTPHRTVGEEPVSLVVLGRSALHGPAVVLRVHARFGLTQLDVRLAHDLLARKAVVALRVGTVAERYPTVLVFGNDRAGYRVEKLLHEASLASNGLLARVLVRDVAH